jgi:hypothetical protein
MTHLEIDIPDHHHRATCKRVSFSPRLLDYGLTYSKYEYDRTPIKATKIVSSSPFNGSSNEEIPLEGSWADAFLSMGSDEFAIWNHKRN